MYYNLNQSSWTSQFKYYSVRKKSHELMLKNEGPLLGMKGCIKKIINSIRIMFIKFTTLIHDFVLVSSIKGNGY
jgi:hypothetical protein